MTSPRAATLARSVDVEASTPRSLGSNLEDRSICQDRRMLRRSLLGSCWVVGVVCVVSAAADSVGFSFRNVAADAGLSAVTVFGGREKNRYLLETTGDQLDAPESSPPQPSPALIAFRSWPGMLKLSEAE